MADEKVSQMPAATTSSGSDLYPLVQGGVNKAITFANLQSALGTGASLTALTGDVSATGPGSATATVNSVGGKTASAIASAVTTVSGATSSNTTSTLVLRDSSGNFSAGTVTMSGIKVTTSPTSGYVLTSDALGNGTWQNPYSLRKTVYTLTSAQILALNGTPVTVVPAVSGKVIQLYSCEFQYTYVSTPYTVGGQGLNIQYTTDTVPPSGSYTAIFCPDTGLLDQTANKEFIMPTISSASFLRSTGLNITTSDTSIAGGNGTLTLVIYYYVLD